MNSLNLGTKVISTTHAHTVLLIVITDDKYTRWKHQVGGDILYTHLYRCTGSQVHQQIPSQTAPPSHSRSWPSYML